MAEEDPQDRDSQTRKRMRKAVDNNDTAVTNRFKEHVRLQGTPHTINRLQERDATQKVDTVAVGRRAANDVRNLQDNYLRALLSSAKISGFKAGNLKHDDEDANLEAATRNIAAASARRAANMDTLDKARKGKIPAK